MKIAVNIITAICFILLTVAVVCVVEIFTRKKSRKERIDFIRSFKKGKCLIVLLIAIPLFYIGYVDKGVGWGESFFSAVSHLVDLIVLKFGLDKVQGLLDNNVFYRITVYYCCILVTLNALMFAMSLLSQNVWRFISSLRFKLSKKDKVYIFGNNEENLDIYESDKTGMSVIVNELKGDDCVKLYVGKVNYISSGNKAVIESIFKRLIKGQEKITVVINTGDDEKNLELCRYISDIINSKDNKTKDILFDRLAVYFFCSPEYEAICDSIVESSCGCIHYKNKYQMIATNFIERYPLAKFMDGRHIDYSAALVKENVNINVCVIGFGSTSRQIFLTSVANNQFLTKSNKDPDGVELKQVNYTIIDKTEVKKDKNLNHTYYRYKNECLDNVGVNKDDYLPLPQLPANEDYIPLDVNAVDFYNTIKDAILGINFKSKKSQDKDKEADKINASFVIIAYGTDVENIDMAHKLAEKRKEWGMDDCLTIFVKVRKSCNYPKLFNEKDVIQIGNEKEYVYNLDEIRGDAIYRMAKMRNSIYDLEYEVTRHKEDFESKDISAQEEAVKRINEASNKKWYITKSQLERDSSVYCCLSLKSKLNLMGLDCCKDGDGEALKEQDYLEIYAKGDMPKFYETQVKGKKIVEYTLDFPPSKRKNLAILEHYRWNSYMISKGIVPSTRAQILSEPKNGKNYSLRRHGNLTTFEGLTEFSQIVANKNNSTPLDEDVIKYDYQLLDDAYWLLNENGYKIIKKK